MGAPNIAIWGTDSQCAVSPARHRPHVPQLIAHGTTTMSPGATVVTASPTSTTRATHSWPIANGAGIGPRPARICESTSQVVAAIGATTASASLCTTGSDASRHSTAHRPT